MLAKQVWTVAAVITLATTVTATPTRQEPAPQTLEAPMITIEGEVVEVDIASHALVVKHFARGVRSRRAFRVTKDTAFGAVDSPLAEQKSPWRLANLKAGDFVKVRYQIQDGRAMAIMVERVRSF